MPRGPRRSGLDGPGPPSWGPQRALDALTAACAAAAAADQVYYSMDALAATWHASLATFIAIPPFHAWERSNPTFKPRLSGFVQPPIVWTTQGPRRVTVLLVTGATHCFICARLAAALGLQPSGQPGPTSVSTAAAGGELGLAAPVLLHLVLGDTFREVMSVSPMDMDVGDDLILGWDWISSHDLHHLYDGRVCLRSGPARTEVLGGAPTGMPPDRGMELELETGVAPMPRSRPVKRLSDGELAELRAQLIDLLDRGWIQHSTAGHAAAAAVFARKGTAGQTSTCGRTTRRSRGSRQIGIRTRCTSAGSTGSRTSAST